MIPVWKAEIYLPPRLGHEKQDSGILPTHASIVFRVAGDDIDYFLNPEECSERLYSYLCETCYYACGNPYEVFRTSSGRTKDMKDGPTGDQQIQMSAHVRQHQVMLQWARGFERRDNEK